MGERRSHAVRRRVRVTGHVQGVFFRQSARRRAERLGLTGFARNEPDGSVLVEVEGAADAVAELVVWCQEGPGDARVESVVVKELEVRGGEGFTTS